MDLLVITERMAYLEGQDRLEPKEILDTQVDLVKKDVRALWVLQDIPVKMAFQDCLVGRVQKDR